MAGVGGVGDAVVPGAPAIAVEAEVEPAEQPLASAEVSSIAVITVLRAFPTRPACHPAVGAAAYARCMFPGGQPDLNQLLQQAQQLQQQVAAAQEQLAQTEVTGTA